MNSPDLFAGRYAIEQLAASGGMATLYRSRDLASGREVAVKLLHGPSAQTPRATARFLREATTLQALRHPSIVRYLDHGTDAHGRPFLVMEWLAGESLDAVLRARGLRPHEAVHVARTIAGALAHCHALGIVHRDVKPSNVVLVGGDPARAILVDFGIAAGEGGGPRATETGTILGTPRYMAPEQLRSARKVDGRADVFGLGCALYEGLTGRHPFGGDDVYAYATRLADGEAAPARSIRPDLPEAASRLAARMLARDPSARPAIDAALLAEMDAVERELRVAPLAAVVVTPVLFEEELASSTPTVVAPSVRVDAGSIGTRGGEPLAPIACAAEPIVRGPAPIGRFVGRAREHAELLARLGGGAAIAVVWGAPGIGKSRLALEACHALVRARRGAASGFVVDLRLARDRADVVRAVAAVLLSGAESASVAEGDVAAVARILRAWGEPVLVLDGADHVRDVVAEVASAWGSARVGATVIVTARGRLGMANAIEIELRALDAASAEELLLVAAGMHDAPLGDDERRAAAQIAEALDFNPLALELAAARVPVLGLAGLAERLEAPLALLGGAAGSSALSMRDALEWSFHLLTPAEQRALAECSVFRGPFTARAAEAVLTRDARVPTIDLLTSLRRSSLVADVHRGGEARLVLARTVRELARSKLTGGDAAAAATRRNAYLAAWAWGLAMDVMRTGSADALAKLATEADELLDVAETSLATGMAADGGDGARVALMAAVALEPVVLMRGPVARYLDVLDRGIAAVEGRDEIAGHARRARGRLLGRRGAEEAARGDLEEACAIAEACGARELADEASLSLGALHQKARRLEEAARIYESVIASSRGQRLRAEASALANLAALAHDARRFEQATRLYEDALPLLDVVGDVRLSAWARVNCALLLQDAGDRAEARRRYRRAIEEATKIGDERLLGFAWMNCGMLDIEEGDLARATSSLERARTLAARAGDLRVEALAVGKLAAAYAMQARIGEATAAAVLAERMAARQGATILGPIRLLRAFADVARARAADAQGDHASAESARMAARARIREATTPRTDGGTPLIEMSDDARAALRVLDRWTADEPAPDAGEGPPSSG